MSIPMVFHSYIFNIKLVGRCTKHFFFTLRFLRKPTQDYSNGFGTSNHSKFDDISKQNMSSILCAPLINIFVLIGIIFVSSLLMYHPTPISVNNRCLLFCLVKRFQKGNGNFLKHFMHFLETHVCSTHVISLKIFKPTINKVKCSDG